jgi:glycosyltransferase involved in cell wall biosynthesis
MKIWLVVIGEPVPLGDGLHDRLHRGGYFASFLAAHGHDVTWWTSTFDHMRKTRRFEEDQTIRLNPWLEIRLLGGGGYRSNLSLARLRDHRRIAGKFARLAAAEADPPQIILAALPTIELCLEAVRFGRRRGVPTVLDMRDMWPDIFVDSVPALARPLMRLLLGGMFLQARRACAGATAITGITEAFVDWGLKRGGRPRSELDRAFPMGYLSAAPAAEKIAAAEKFWDQQGVVADADRPVACFFGTLGRQFDLDTALAAAQVLEARGSKFRLVICGTGDRFEHYRESAAGLSNVLLPGWVDAAAIHVLMRRSACGLDPLSDRYDFLATINNKAIEYLSAGLPVVSSPRRGTLAELLAREECGLSYDLGDAAGLAKSLVRLGDEPALRGRMAANAAALFARSFTAEKVYGSMMEYLEKIAFRDRAGASRARVPS